MPYSAVAAFASELLKEGRLKGATMRVGNRHIEIRNASPNAKRSHASLLTTFLKDSEEFKASIIDKGKNSAGVHYNILFKKKA